MKKAIQNNIYILVLLFIYFIVHLFFLTNFPFVHSDEAWLSGLTRNMMETRNIYSTEPFFNLYPRYPHTIKLLFHLIQMPFLYFGGYTVFSVRIISLLFSMATLYLFYQIILLIEPKKLYAVPATLLLSLNLQFIYSAHFARQEIIILFCLLLGFYIYIKPKDNYINPTLLLGSVIGFSIGIHPNSFILALVFGGLYLYDWITHKKALKALMLLVVTVSCYASVFITLSFIGDPDFISHYLQYGSSFGVETSIGNKFSTLDNFYYKLYHSISGTYYVPQMKYFWIAFLFLILISINLLLYKKAVITKTYLQLISKCLLALFATQLGILFIGRYNSTSIVFAIPFFYILLTILLMTILKKKKALIGTYAILTIFTVLLISPEIKPYLNYRYNNYINELASILPQDAKTLGNLSAGFYFENGKLLDFRNLTYLEENGQSFYEYIKLNEIDYIVFYEELEYIHKNSEWLVLYGDDPYYEDMIQFINIHCTQIHSFTDMVYGVRIPRYMMDYPWEVRIYRVNIN